MEREFIFIFNRQKVPIGNDKIKKKKTASSFEIKKKVAGIILFLPFFIS